MKLSDFEMTVIDVLIKGDPEEQVLREQLNGAYVEKREYTGVGLFTEIVVTNNRPRIEKSNRFIEEKPKVHLEHPDLKDGAGALLWFDEGYISMLECYAYENSWPRNEALFKIIS
ncbi:MAG: hypothetical protein AB2806_21040 [Candidatus Thiodiazotropha sp.]